MENEILTTNCANSWSTQDIKQLGMALTAIYDGLSSYGQPLKLESRVALWKMALEDEHTMEAVLSALKIHCKKSSAMPTPADIVAILKPVKPKVSHAEFIHAKDQWAKEGYPQFSYYHMIVMEYEKENADERAAPAPIEDPKILKIVQSSIKRIT